MHSSLCDHLPKDPEDKGKAKLVMARVSNFPCPANLDKKPSVLHIHPSNGVFVAVDSGTVYCTCTECSFEEDREVKGGNLALVEGTEKQRYAWAILNEEIYSKLISTTPVTGATPRSSLSV